jgi:hypothetical protein
MFGYGCHGGLLYHDGVMLMSMITCQRNSSLYDDTLG